MTKKAITQIYYEKKITSKEKTKTKKSKKKGKEKKKKSNEACLKKKKKKRATEWTSPCASSHEHFCHLSIKFLPLGFLSILEREHFGGPGEKTPGPHQFFPLPSLQPNIHQKSFYSYFLFKIFHPPYLTSKQTQAKYQSVKGSGVSLIVK